MTLNSDNNHTHKSYGVWITKNDIISVNEECHAEEAYKILTDRFNHPEEIKLKRWFIYSVMYRLGYVRLVYNEKGYSVEYWKQAKLNRFQKDIIKEAEDNSPIRIYQHESIIH